MLKNPPANAEDVSLRFDLWVGKIPGGGHGSPLQYSCLENPMDRGAWWATVHGVTKSQTSLKRLRTHVSGEGNTKGALQITGGKIFSFNHLYSFSSSICPMLSSGAGLLTVEKENGRRVFSEGDSSSPDFQS